MKTSSAECALALDAGGTSIKGALVTRDYSVVDFFDVPVMEDGIAQTTLNSFTAAGSKGAEHAAARGFSLIGVGVCIPGPFDYANGISLMDHKYRAIRGISLTSYISSGNKNIPVRFMHDSSAFLMGELTLRPEQGGDLCGVTIGTGLGFACTKGGRIFENENGGPGISIFRLPYRSETAEDFVSKRGILRAYRQISGNEAESVKTIDDLARSGDENARRTFWETGETLADILAPILLKNNFLCMILGGQIAKAGVLLTEPMERYFSFSRIPCRVETARKADISPLLGAANLIFRAN